MIRCVWNENYVSSVMKFIYFLFFKIHIINPIYKFCILNLPIHPNFRKTICLILFQYDVHFQLVLSSCYVSIIFFNSYSKFKTQILYI